MVLYFCTVTLTMISAICMGITLNTVSKLYNNISSLITQQNKNTYDIHKLKDKNDTK